MIYIYEVIVLDKCFRAVNIVDCGLWVIPIFSDHGDSTS